MNQKTALVLSGGGMAASYNVGALLALIEKYNFVDPNIVIAGSGSAGTASYYVAKQYESIPNVWNNLLSTKKLINIFRFWKILDVDYLIDEVLRKQDPLDQDKVYQSNINYLIAATNNNSGKAEYFSNQDRTDIFELMRATKAVPVLYGKKIKINNQYYTDGANSTAADFNLLKAQELKADKIIVIAAGIAVNRSLLKFWLFFKSKLYRAGMRSDYNKRNSLSEPTAADILYIKPPEKLKIGLWNNSKRALQEIIQQGYDDVVNSEEVGDFFLNYNEVSV